ncbi:hypothetical protein LX59_02153 [Azomonas agilis]|uniref:Uncharacterized protein n=1 Tax=Azomonas agilis TaxID=116849 RepID=A0A562I298_9GAMM|nr:hypothetical protein LX59_02153 [Azomonas agilis]
MSFLSTGVTNKSKRFTTGLDSEIRHHIIATNKLVLIQICKSLCKAAMN